MKTITRYGHRFPDGTYRSHNTDSGKTTDLSEAATYPDRKYAEFLIDEMKKMKDAKVVTITVTYQAQ